MEFNNGSVPIKIVAKVYGKDPAWVRRGVVSGYLPIGVATRNGEQITDVALLDRKYGRTNFYISPKKLYEDTGYIWRDDDMTTSIRADISKKNKYWISKHRYYELKHFCLQYDEWVKEVFYDSTNSKSIIHTTNDISINDYTSNIAIKNLHLKKKMQLVEDTCSESDEVLSSYILLGVTKGVSYENLKSIHNIPCGRDMYYDRYRKFFWLLDKNLPI